MAESGNNSGRPRTDSKEKPMSFRLVLVGRTGAGKSSSGNTILGRDAFKSAGGPSSETSECSKKQEEVCDRLVSVVDTPGLFDTTQTNDLVKEEISKCINMSTPGPHAFLLVIEVGRFAKEEKDSIMQVQEIFGEDVWKFTIIIFTHGDLVKQDFDKQLKRAPPALQEILKKVENRYQLFNNIKANDRRQVVDLLEKVEKLSDKGEKHYTNLTYLEVKKKLDQTESELREFYKKKLEEEIKALDSKYKDKMSEAKKHEAELKELKRFYNNVQKRIRPNVEKLVKDNTVDKISNQLNEKLGVS